MIRFSPNFITTFAISVLVPSIIFAPHLTSAGIYRSSAHGNATSGVSRSGLNAVTTRNYATGNCAHCHEQHASVTNVEPDPPGNPDNYLGMEAEQDLCLHCHGLGGNEGTMPADINIDISKTSGSRHHVGLSDTVHRAKETLSDIADKAAHIECTDCHNPHSAENTLHIPANYVQGSIDSNDILTSSPLYGATGADPNYDANANNIWEAPLQSEYTLQKPATKEYQVCFKCHSASVGTPATWSNTTGSEAWTDVGLEFNPYNLSGHPVVTGLNNYSNSITVDRGTGPYKGLYNTTDGTDWDQLLDPWGTNAGNQTMYCSDCHSSNSSVAGPHGSDIKWMLAGDNKAWPYTTHARNGSNDTEDPDNLIIIFRRIKHLQEAPLGDIGTDNGLFCANCHPMTQWTNPTNNVHSNGNHTNARCIDCHIRVPHGGKVSRLIASVDYGTYQNHLPPRYTGNGEGLNGSGGTQPSLRQFHKRANYSYNAGRCLSDSTALEIAFSDTKRCDFHGVGPGAFFAESW